MMSERLDRVRALIEAPLLVSKPVNTLYLTGLDSSNAVLLVEPGRSRVFTDFRYAEKARGLGLDLVVLPRQLFTELGQLVSGKLAEPVKLRS